MAPRYRHLGITLLADSLYAVHPFVELVGRDLQIFDVPVAAGEELHVA